MKTRLPLALAVCGSFLFISLAASPQEPPRPAAAAPYGTGSWDADTLGNHRVVLRVAASGGAAWAHIEWRRRDRDPDQKNLFVVDGRTGSKISNVFRAAITRESGDIVFEPVSGPGQYYVYYLPNVGSGRSNYPKVVYPAPQNTANEAWLQKNTGDAWRTLPKAEVVEFQAIDEFNSFYPMEVIATAVETRGLVAKHPDAAYLLFPEDRRFPIRMTDDLPQRWIRAGANAPFRGEAGRGEFYAFQVGLYALKPIDGVAVRFSNLASRAGEMIPASSLRCFNLGGTDWTGKHFDKHVRVAAGTVQPLWFGVQVPANAAAGDYEGTVTFAPAGLPESRVALTIAVGSQAIAASGDDEPWRHSRLRWLDSTYAMDDELVAPYTPVTVAGHHVGVLGRGITVGTTGFPDAIESFFAEEMTRLGERPRQVLTGPVALRVESADPSTAVWSGKGPRFVKQARGAAAWEAESTAGPLRMKSRAQMEFDGNIEYEVEITAAQPTVVSDIRLEIPMARDAARYMMGMGVKGGLRPTSYRWEWDVEHNQDSAWIGDVNAGLQFTLKDEHYSRPLNTNFYHQKPLVMPVSWWNGGRGGCRFSEQDAKTFLVGCYSGPRVVTPGQPLRYDFRMLLTPFHPLDTKAQFSTRFFHAFKPVAEVAATGANVANVHHATEINPYINYPFLRPAEMKAYIDEAHAKGLKVKIYYTVRELSNRAPELFALRSLGDEIVSKGPGGGFSWLQEHLVSDYIAAWFVPELKDAAVINTGVSRWHNYYVEGLNWLVKNVGIDGLYIDDVAFDRTTMKRVRKVLDRGRPGALIDLHSANQFNVRDGYASSANLYLEHFPFLNRLWFGEYFDYGSAPDYWLTEISGIPFGLMGEMLQDNGNPWRGMVYGMTGRLPWAGDPRPLWKAWDAFGITDSRMIGYWVESRPVKADRPELLTTSYVKNGRVMVAIASWANNAVDARLTIDWKALGLDPARATITAPAIEKFQEARTFKTGDPIPVEPGKGWLLVIQ